MQFSREEVARHNTAGDLWVILNSEVYDLSKFAKFHPGGSIVLLSEEVAGRDATEAFYSLHRHEVLEKNQYMRFKIGVIQGEEVNIFKRKSGSLSQVPYAEPTWLVPGFHSPYYKESHKRFQVAVRGFVEEVIYPDAQAREEDGNPPSQHVIDEMAKMNLIAMRLGPGPHLRGRVLMGGIVEPAEFDNFHELIIAQELARIHARGYSDGLGGGTCIGLPPVLNFGKKELRERVAEEVLSGKKYICLAVTEAFAGSDVAGVKCRASRVVNGWVVNGTPSNQKWITNGTFADYFTVACRTDKGGLVALLVPRGPGISTTLIKTSYSTAAGTSFIQFDNVFVPANHVLGRENHGLQVILSNFNHERWGLTSGSIGGQRAILEECLKWAALRKVFGKPLTSQPVVRAKLAGMIARVESCQNWLESVTYQMTKMNYEQQALNLAGQLAFLKMYSTRAAQETAADAVQIFGGRGITRTGMGRLVEHYHRTLLIDAVGGGAEDVLGDLGVRQALRKMPDSARL
ncbi:acyl-CoA dehydrogenase NM domain-like protein [Pluteus cervinus]|uniref:Acyl-CoA dehydrogenase NM domain-like protein n=1 Tax=Pluteus cervinus TaxID=181527 RepID=A0ACD3B5I3_9AGAR|nr:acyl-CoA dehydrogenase NM domain-like protein [Pluteus cervinus]